MTDQQNPSSTQKETISKAPLPMTNVISTESNLNQENKKDNVSSQRQQEIVQVKENKEEEKIELTPYRFVIVVSYFLLNFANGMAWVTYSSTADKFRQAYDMDRMLVDLFSMIFMIEYPLVCVPEAYLVDNISMRAGLIVASVGNILGAGLKCLTNHSIAWAYVGQVLAGLFQPAILNSPAKIASVWFKDDSRALVTSICCVANNIGVMFGFIYHTFFINDDSVGQKYKDQFYDYVFWEFILIAILSLPTIFLIRTKPKVATSVSQKDYESPPLGKSLCLLFHNKNFMLFLIVSTCVVGFFNIYGTIFNPYMALYGISDDEASYSLACANFLGIVGCLVVSAILDKSKKFKMAMLILNIVGLCFMVLVTITLELIDSHPFVQCIILYSFIIISVTPIYTTGMDYVCELTYPVGESVSGGLIMFCNQLSGIVGILICDALIHHCQEYKYLTNVIAIALFVGSLIPIIFIEEKLLRTEKENEQGALPASDNNNNSNRAGEQIVMAQN